MVDDPDGAGTCRGSIQIIQICGPLTGTYTLDIAQETTAYSVSICARSKGRIDGNSLYSSRSEADFAVVVPATDFEVGRTKDIHLKLGK
jgi:hypothetical protein